MRLFYVLIIVGIVLFQINELSELFHSAIPDSLCGYSGWVVEKKIDNGISYRLILSNGEVRESVFVDFNEFVTKKIGEKINPDCYEQDSHNDDI